MADSEKYKIGGTIIQRSFVPRHLGNVLNVATVPIAEICTIDALEDDESGLRLLTSELLGIPRESIIDDAEYKKLKNSFRDGGYRRLFRGRFPYWELVYDDFIDYLFDPRRNSEERSSVGQFADDSLCLLASPATDIHPFLFPQLGFDTRRREINESELNLSSEALKAGLSCYLLGQTAEVKVREAVEDIRQYDIPIGQSPRASSDSLLKLIDSSKKMCLAPVVAAGTLGISQLGQGGYVAALLTVGTGSAMTLVLVGTLSVSDLLVRRMISKRPGEPSDSQK